MRTETQSALPFSPLDMASMEHADRFGAYPGILSLSMLGRDDEIADLIREAVKAGKPLDVGAVERAWGLSPIPRETTDR